MIIINDEPALKIKCVDVLPDEVADLTQLLEKELEQSARLGRPGVGLAAPQIGIGKNIAIVRLGSNGYNNFNVDLVNCKISNGYDQKMFTGEGCLSFPGRIENTMRYQEVHINNNLVYPNNFIATGLLAVVCQHELDHLVGILLPDKAIEKINYTRPRPNDMCKCGSKIKYKKCCGKVK
jgi:peptide deformylase